MSRKNRICDKEYEKRKEKNPGKCWNLARGKSDLEEKNLSLSHLPLTLVLQADYKNIILFEHKNITIWRQKGMRPPISCLMDRNGYPITDVMRREIIFRYQTAINFCLNGECWEVEAATNFDGIANCIFHDWLTNINAILKDHFT